MSEYTPTTEEVRDGFSFSPSFSTQRNREAGFARWLAGVKVDIWAEGFEAGQDEADGHEASRQWGGPHTCITNPYREETE